MTRGSYGTGGEWWYVSERGKGEREENESKIQELHQGRVWHRD
jgi:hypothetical protein